MVCKAVIENSNKDKISKKKDLEHHPRKVNEHLEQCDGSCEIVDQDLVNMDGLSLSLVDNEETDKNAENAGEELEKEGQCQPEDFLEGTKEVELESEVEKDKSDSNSKYTGQPNTIRLILKRPETVNQIEEEEEMRSTSSTELSTSNKIPSSVRDDDNDDIYEDSATDFD